MNPFSPLLAHTVTHLPCTSSLAHILVTSGSPSGYLPSHPLTNARPQLQMLLYVPTPQCWGLLHVKMWHTIYCMDTRPLVSDIYSVFVPAMKTRYQFVRRLISTPVLTSKQTVKSVAMENADPGLERQKLIALVIASGLADENEL